MEAYENKMSDNNNLYGFLFGMTGGFIKYLFIDASVFTRFGEAIITAFFCGVFGVLGKMAFTWSFKKIKKKLYE